jgi:SAM-dependent methyltransferase
MNVLVIVSTSRAFKNIRTLALSAEAIMKIDKVLLAIGQEYIDARWPQRLAGVIDAPVEAVGAATGADVLRAIYAATEAPAESGWVHVCFDDSYLVAAPPMSAAGASDGMLYTEHVSACMEDWRNRQAGDLYSIPCERIQRSLDLASLQGSFFSVRTGALSGMRTDFKIGVDRAIVRVIAWYAMKNLGILQDDRITHVRRSRARSEEENKRSEQAEWFAICNRLEGSTGDRYWQNWDASGRVQRVEKFWKDDKDQVDRRQQLYDVLADVHRLAPGSVLLDAGCGVCFDKETIENIGFDYHGSDVTPEMLERAKERHGDVKVYLDDMLDSGFDDGQWPVVLCSAVIPHLPPEHHQTALNTLWRIAGKCLIVRFFGVDLAKQDLTTTLKGFLYSQFREKTWRGMFEKLAPAPRRIQCHRGSGATKDVLIVVAHK